jgi:hypothetical protein
MDCSWVHPNLPGGVTLLAVVSRFGRVIYPKKSPKAI